MWPVRALFFVAALLPAQAWANPWDLYGFNARALGMSGALTAAADDFTAVYYNPAGLTFAKDAGFGFGYTWAKPKLRLNFEKEARSISEVNPPDSDGITFGASFPIGGGRFKDRIAFGLGINVPTSSVLSGQAIEQSQPQWYMYQALPRRIVAALGFAVVPVEGLSVGAAVQILAGLTGHLDYELDIVAGRFSRKTVIFDIKPQIAPLLGIEARPLDGLRLGVGYRAAIGTQVNLPVQLEVSGLADLTVSTDFEVQYTPHQVSFGASYFLRSVGLQVSADLTYALWSKAPDPAVDSRLDVAGELFEGTGLADALDVPAQGQERTVNLGFRDVFVPRFGAEKHLGPFRIRGGYSVRPSPAPVQTSGTNYVDATTHQLSLGAGLRFLDPLGAFANPILFDVGGGLFLIPKRRMDKPDALDPVGSYEASGAIWAFSVTLSYGFGEAPAEPAPAAELPR